MYTDERDVQIMVALMKAHGIRKVVASPGTTNVTFVVSIQNDPFFEVYSSVDERSAAYIACGLAAESGEPVALSCTGATASRNYLPGLTEAYYRKLPVLAITSTYHTGRVGQNIPQQIDRFAQPNDVVMKSVQVPLVHDSEDEWSVNVAINDALLELRRRGGGPVHINLTTTYSKKYVDNLPPTRVIQRVSHEDDTPAVPQGRIVVFVGNHVRWDDGLVSAVDYFCEKYDAVVLCDHTSNYHGKYRVFPTLVTEQESWDCPLKRVDLLIDMGNVSGAYVGLDVKEVWRVNPDGAVRDTWRKLSYVFEMSEEEFFSRLAREGDNSKATTANHEAWQDAYAKVRNSLPEIPLSNEWLGQVTVPRLPNGCRLHLGILNSLRTWNHYPTDPSITGYSDTGGFGIDGDVSALIGCSLADTSRICIGVVGDLAFFYDMNSLGNRHVGRNVRLIVVNNGRGTEFRQYFHVGGFYGDKTDEFIAAAGHYGCKSPRLVKHYAEDLGFEYHAVTTKDEYLAVLDRLTCPELTEKPILVEVFTDSKDESDAVKIVRNAVVSETSVAKKQIITIAKKVLGDNGVQKAKELIRGR